MFFSFSPHCFDKAMTKWQAWSNWLKVLVRRYEFSDDCRLNLGSVSDMERTRYLYVKVHEALDQKFHIAIETVCYYDNVAMIM